MMMSSLATTTATLSSAVATVGSSANRVSVQSVEKLSTLKPEQFGLYGKDAEWTQLLKYIEQGQSKLCLLLGDSGSGKSALLGAVANAVQNQQQVGTLPVKNQLLVLDFLTLPPEMLASTSFNGLLLTLLQQWIAQLEAHCLAVLSAKTPTGFSLVWNAQTLADVMQQATQQSSVAQRRTFLESYFQRVLRSQQNWVDKLFSPMSEAVTVLAQTLDNPWFELLVDCQQQRLPNLQRWAVQAQTSDEAAQQFERELLGTLILMTDFFKQHLSSAATGEATLTLIVDNWDILQVILPTETFLVYQASLMALVKTFQEKKQQPFHVIVGVRTNELGRSLGHTLYGYFRNKQLLSPLTPSALEQFVQAEQLLPETLQQPVVFEWLAQYAQGNPYWLQLLCQAIVRKTSRYLPVDATEETVTDSTIIQGWLAGLAVEHATDCHAFLLTQLQLGVVQHGVAYGQALQQTVAHLTYQPFDVPSFLELMTTVAPQLAVNDVALVLRKLFVYGCLIEVESQSAEQQQNNRCYQIRHRLLLGYLKAQLTQTRLSQQFNLLEQQEANWFEAKQQLQTLQTILPLTLEQGELTVEKVQGLLNLTQQFQPEFKETFITFFISLMEQTLADDTCHISLKNDALAALAQLNQERFLPLLLKALAPESDKLLQHTALVALAKQGSLQGGQFALAQRTMVLQQLLACCNVAEESVFAGVAMQESQLFSAIEAWAFPLKAENKSILLSFLQQYLVQYTQQSAGVSTAVPIGFIQLANHVLADVTLSDDERTQLLPEVMALVGYLLQQPLNNAMVGQQLLQLVKQYSVENTPEPLFQLLEQLASPELHNPHSAVVQQEALTLLLARLNTRDNALQAWLQQLEADMAQVINATIADEDQQRLQAMRVNKRFTLAYQQTQWDVWAKQQLLQMVKTQLTQREWQAWLAMPDLLWVLLKGVFVLNPCAETTTLGKQWLERLTAPVFEEFESVQLLVACLRGQLQKI
jgi:energy-coupling factor transporter ATP-binding protein EcfA2